MNDSQQLRESMWDLLYGLLSDEENQSLIARIKSDPHAARLYSEVALQADLVGRAAKVEDSSLVFDGSQVAEATARPTQPQAAVKSAATPKQKSHNRSAAWFAAAGATALVALLVVGSFWPRADQTGFAHNLVAIDLLATQPMSAGLTNQVAMRTYFVSTDGKEVDGTSANVELRVLDGAGQELMRRAVKTDSSGQATVDIPGEMLEPGVRLEVANADAEGWTASNKGSEMGAGGLTAAQDNSESLVAVELPVQPEPQMAYFLVSEPTVEAGKPVEVSLWNFAAFSNKLSSPDTTRAVIETVEGIKVQDAPANGAQQGLLNATLEIPQIGQAGELAAEVRDNSGQKLNEQLARAKRDGTPGRESQPQASAAAPAAVPGQALANVRLRQSLQRQAGLSEQIVEQNAGRRVGQQYRARNNAQSQDPQAEAAGAPRADSQPIPASIAAGQPIKLRIPAELAGKALVATAVCRGATVATAVTERTLSRSSNANRAESSQQSSDELTLDLPPEADGLIEVSLFDRSTAEPTLVEQHFVYREPLRKLQIELAGGKNRFAPGEQVQIELRVTDEQGKPASDTRLGVRVWNERLVEQSAAQPVMLADAVRGGYVETTQDFKSQLQRGAVDELSTLASADQEKDAAKEQRKLSDGADKPLPATADVEQLASGQARSLGDDRSAPNTDSYQSVTAPIVPASRVELASNREEVRSAIRTSADSAAGTRRYALTAIGTAAVIGGVLLLLVIGIDAALRMGTSLQLLAPTVGVALASVLVGLSWIGWIPLAQRADIALTTKPAPTTFADSATPLADAMDRGAGAASSKLSSAPAEEMELASSAKKEGTLRELAPTIAATPAPTASADSVVPTQPQEPLPARGGGLSGQASLGSPPGAPARPALAGAPQASPLTRAADVRERGEELAEGKSIVPLAAGGAAPAAPLGGAVARSAITPTSGARGGLGGAAGQQAATAEGTVAPPALYFNPQLVTDAQGRASVQFVMPAVESEYLLLVDALGHGRVGSRQDQLIIQNAPAAK